MVSERLSEYRIREQVQVTFRDVGVQSSPGVDSLSKEQYSSVAAFWTGWTVGLDWTTQVSPTVMMGKAL